jgi:integrase/recombinase XerD
MRRRGYSREVIWARFANAIRWVSWSQDWRTATFEDVEDWIAERDVSPQSSRNLLGYVRAFYRWALRKGLVEHDPTQLVDPYRVPKLLPHPASDRDIHAVLESADAQLAAMVALMAGAGLRCCEVSRLDWRDVDVVGGRVHVHGKGAKERVIDVSADVRRRLAALDSSSGPVFVGKRGGRLSAARVSQIVCRALDAVESDATAHWLRHRFATTALRQPDADLLAVRDAMGHSSVATTQIYTLVVPGKTAAMSRAVMLP